MLDQSFSAENFRKIYDVENRKGTNLCADYSELAKVKDLTADIKSKCVEIKNVDRKDENKKEKAKEELLELKRKKENELTSILEAISNDVTKGKLDFVIKKGCDVRGKPTYFLDNKLSNFFISKQIQSNLKKLFNVKQSSRNILVSQLIASIDDHLPKYVIKTDVKGFYENVSQELLIKKIDNNRLLSFISKRIIKDMIKQYNALSGTSSGLPRGIGISAYLAELFMKDFDSRVKDYKDVIFYGRYIDDIVMVLSAEEDGKSKEIIEFLRKEARELGLELSDDGIKTKDFYLNINEGRTDLDLEYLGYKFSYDSNKKFTVGLSSKKIDKYKKRIEASFTHYIKAKNKRKARYDLIRRAEFLMGNTKLFNNKGSVFVGIYYSNRFLTNLDVLRELDKYFSLYRDKLRSSSFRKSLKNYKFVDGFNKKVFIQYNTALLERITAIWKYND